MHQLSLLSFVSVYLFSTFNFFVCLIIFVLCLCVCARQRKPVNLGFSYFNQCVVTGPFPMRLTPDTDT